MQLKEFDILLDVKKHTQTEYIEVVQGDSFSNVLNISLVDGIKPFNLTGTTVEIVFSKSDGTTVQQTDIGIINAAEGQIQCTLNTNTIASPGKTLAEVRVLEGTTLLTSTRFELYVRKAIINDETIESTNEFPVLTQLINTTNGLIDQVSLIEAQVPAQVVTDLNAVSVLANQIQSDFLSHKAEKVSDDVHGLAFRGVKVRKTTEQSIANGTVANITFDTKTFDTDGCFELATPTRLICKTPGYYFIGGSIKCGAGSGLKDLIIRKNGLTTYEAYSSFPSSSSGSGFLNISCFLKLEANEYVQLGFYQTSGSALSVLVEGNIPFFYMYKVGE